MKLAHTRDIVIAQCLEETDAGGRLITDEEKRLAESAAGAPLPKDVSRREQDAFLAQRAANAIGTVEPRLEGDRGWLRQQLFRSKFGWFALIAVVVAAIVGYLTNEFDPDGKVNLLKLPLIGIIVWNLLVYLVELTFLFRKEGAASSFAGVITRMLVPPSMKLEKSETESALEFRARSLFHSRWRHLSIPALSARTKSILHITALVLAAAAIVGMYVRGLSKEYNAVWESTFFEKGEQLEPFLKVPLGPALAVTGDRFNFTADELDGLRQTQEAPNDGKNARKWIHLYAISIAIFVLIPRLFLALLWHLKAVSMDRGLPFRDLNPAYYERVLAVSTGDSLPIYLVPYAHKPGDSVVQGIRTHMEAAFERPVSISWQDGIAFGEEEEATADIAINTQPMILFNFGSTPERETHLALYQQLREELPEGSRPYQIVLDCEAFDRKNDSFTDADERRATRLSAWKKLFAAEKNCQIHIISEHEMITTQPATTTETDS